MNNTFMKKKPILPLLASMAMPMVLSMLVNSLYNIVDSFFVAKISEQAMTALSLVFPVQNFINAVAIGFGVGINAQISFQLGAKNIKNANIAATHGMLFNIIHGIIFTVICIPFMPVFLSMFTKAQEVISSGVQYSTIAFAFSTVIMISLSFEKIFQAVGRMKLTMISLMIGCISNIILDPLLIFGIGPFARMEAAGAAIATVTAQVIVTAVFLVKAVRDQEFLGNVRIWEVVPVSYMKTMVGLGLPSAIQNLIYAGISMVLTRFVAVWGDAAVAVQRVGSQIESISWMTADGFAASINSFAGQNFGGKRYDRVQKGYFVAAACMFVWGTFCSFLLIFGAQPIFRLFIQETDVIPMGVQYLTVLGLSQMFMCIESMTVGALSGIGKTFLSSIISISLTSARVPLAFLLQRTPLGLNGVWWALSLTSVAKGIIFFIVYLKVLKNLTQRGETN